MRHPIKQYRLNFGRLCKSRVYGQITLNLVQSPELSNAEPGQYWYGWTLGSARWCKLLHRPSQSARDKISLHLLAVDVDVRRFFWTDRSQDVPKVGWVCNYLFIDKSSREIVAKLLVTMEIDDASQTPFKACVLIIWKEWLMQVMLTIKKSEVFF